VQAGCGPKGTTRVSGPGPALKMEAAVDFDQVGDTRPEPTVLTADDIVPLFARGGGNILSPFSPRGVLVIERGRTLSRLLDA
jgi:hypothetical protein